MNDLKDLKNQNNIKFSNNVEVESGSNTNKNSKTKQDKKSSAELYRIAKALIGYIKDVEEQNTIRGEKNEN